MNHRVRSIFAATLLLAAPAVGRAALATYSQDFETLVMSAPGALSGNGWVVYGNVFTPAHVYIYGYGTYPAPNGGNAFSAIVNGQGGAPQGVQQLSVYNDYNNLDHANGNLVEANVFREQTIGAADVGNTWTFQFEAKMGNLVGPSTALAFIKTLNPSAGYATTNFVTADMSATPASWNTYTLSLSIDAGLVGQLLQFGFSSTATSYLSSGIVYDNLNWSGAATTGVGDQGRPSVAELRSNVPNPFQNSTRLDYSLPEQGFVEISVYDLAGRRVKTLFRGESEAGPHAAMWDGRLSNGRLAPAGVYHGVLQTATGRATRNLVIAR